MKILGIDPGSRITGFGVIEFIDFRNYYYVSSGSIKTHPKSTLTEKIHVIASGVQEIIDTYKPEQVAVEKVFVNINPQATLTLGQARGAILAAVALKEIPIYEYTALQVKQSVVGKGKADKQQVQHMIVHMLNLSGVPQIDASDALAVALTHILKTMSPAAYTFLKEKINS